MKDKKKQCYLCHKSFTMDHFVLKKDQYGKDKYYCKINLEKTKIKKEVKGVKIHLKIKDKNTKYLKYKYNITKEYFESLYLLQNNECAICKNKFLEHMIDIDHSHKTNKIRGLLCPNCNAGLGLLGDNLNFLQKAIEYLNKYN
jgi:hypothetical protein